jgi:hypothetical protein
MVREAVGFSGSAIARQREDRALSDEMRRGIVFIEVVEDRGEVPRECSSRDGFGSLAFM